MATENEDLVLKKALAIMEKKDDEFDIFGQFIASEIRQLSNPSTRFALKSEIMKVIQRHAYSSVLVTTNTQHTYTQPVNNNYSNPPFGHNPAYSAPHPDSLNGQQYNNNLNTLE